MNLFQSIGGTVDIELISANIPETLNAISSANIVLENIHFPSALTVHAQIARTDLRKIRIICNNRGDRIHVKHTKGIYWSVKSLLNRPVLTVAVLLICILAMWLPSHVLFIQVSGNRSVSTDAILDQAAKSGVYFGASSRSVRSEQVKNMLLEQIPQLQWVGVNTSGCVATIQVKENAKEIQPVTVSGTFDICASRDAFITYVHATKGTVSCQAGQAVMAGQTLIAAHMQTGETILYTGTAGEVYGDTVRKTKCITLVQMEKRGRIIAQDRKISLIIGKNQINLHNGSGICSSSCVKIIEEDQLMLPGGFLLPFIVRIEHITYYETDDITLPEERFDWMEAYCRDYTKQQMIAGKILTGNFTKDVADDLYILYGDFTCNEMIGSIMNEGISHGENR